MPSDAGSVYLEVYGCWLSKAEAEVVKTLIERQGWRIAPSPEAADAVIVFTCAVRQDTERKMLRIIRRLAEKTIANGNRLVVAGCLARVRPAKIARIAPHADLVSPDSLEEIPRILRAEERQVLLTGVAPRCTMPRYGGGVRYVVPIATGCLGSCAFCVGKYARPMLRSYPRDLVVRAVKRAVEKGAKEVYLTAQDVAAYGLDIGSSLPELLEKILSEVEGDYRIRIGMMEPSLLLRMLDDMAELMGDPRVYKYVHAPCQSCDDEVLKLMNRRYSYDDFKEIVSVFRRRYPEITIATDVIVGFPGETWEAFQTTLKRLEELEIDKIHLARYTLRPFTMAAYMKQLPDSEKKRRSRIAMRRVMLIMLRRNMRYLGARVKALVTDDAGRSLTGRTDNYKPVILPRGYAEPGEHVIAEIIGCTPVDLRGRLTAVNVF